MEVISKKELIDFEKEIANLFDRGEIPYLIHLSGGNEDQLIEIFKNINPGDYIFSTHRSHYHYLLAGGSKEKLKEKILNGQSMFVFDKKLNFLCSSIVAGTPSIAAGVALALKRKGSKKRVWCFVGDGAEDEGHFCEAARYVDGWDLPCTFIIEDNNRSVNTPKSERYGKSEINWPNCVKRYLYTPTYPHGGTENFVEIKKEPIIEEDMMPSENADSPNILTDESYYETLNYKQAIKKTMEDLAKREDTVFIGYNVKYGSAYGTLKDVPVEKKIETPLAENLMTGLAIGMSLEGFKPILFFERFDFIFNALEGIVNHIDKLEKISKGEFKSSVLIRIVVGAKKPIYAGLTHSQNFTNSLRQIVSMPVYELNNSQEVIDFYNKSVLEDNSSILVEKKELYDKDFKIIKQIEIPEEYTYVSAFLTMRCNLNCSFCLNSIDKSRDFNRSKFKELSGEQWVKALNRLKSRPDLPITFSGGEPFLHPDFIYILNNLKTDLKIDILTNLNWGEAGIQKFIREVNPERIKRDAPYASIRVSYHPEQMGDGAKLVESVKKLQDAGFSIGIWSVLYPNPEQLSAINQMQFLCKKHGIDFRLKEYTGRYKGELYGNYSKYPGAIFNNDLKKCQCKTSELLIGPNGNVYKCHRDTFNEEFPLGNITAPDFKIESKYRECSKYGECHPCDVKVKTNYKQELGHTSVDIKI